MTDTRSKGHTYLPTTTVQVLAPPGDVEALVPTGRETFKVRWSETTGWACSCPAKTPTCGHIAAVRLVVIVHRANAPAADTEPEATS